MSGAAQEGPAGPGLPQSVLAAFDALRNELQAMVQEVDARTEKLEQFAEGLKSGAADPVVRETSPRQTRGTTLLVPHALLDETVG